MKILHISNYYPPHFGGIEQVARNIVRGCSEIAEQRLICFHSQKGDLKEISDEIPIIRAGTFCKISSQSLSFSFSKLLKEEFNSFQPDVVIFHYPNPFQAHALLKRLKNRPNCKLLLWWHLDITKQKILGKLFRGQTLRLLKRAEKVIATSPNYIDGSKFLSAFREKCLVIPNCASDSAVSIDQEVLSLSEKIKTEQNGKLLLFALGRHVPYKGIEYLVRASRLLPNRYSVYIGGQGPLTDSLKELAKGDEKVVFLGKLDDVTRKAYMLACDIFCFPSITKNEAFGIALAEAMSFGKPAVTFTIDGSGVNYVSVNNLTGIEVENGNVKAYAEAIETLFNEDLRKQYGENAKARVEQLFTEKAFHENVRSLIESVS